MQQEAVKQGEGAFCNETSLGIVRGLKKFAIYLYKKEGYESQVTTFTKYSVYHLLLGVWWAGLEQARSRRLT